VSDIPTLHTRKPIRQLTEANIGVFTVWEYALDEEEVPGQDETWVKPVDGGHIPVRLGHFFVAADLTTSGGRYLVGPERWRPRPWAGLAESLGVSEEQVRPISYVLRAPIDGRKRSRTGTV
jgi:hypothetical protein